jgi:hypothetical protein
MSHQTWRRTTDAATYRAVGLRRQRAVYDGATVGKHAHAWAQDESLKRACLAVLSRSKVASNLARRVTTPRPKATPGSVEQDKR